MKKVIAIILTVLILPATPANADVNSPFPGPVYTNPVAANKIAQLELELKNKILKGCTAPNGEIILGFIPGAVVKDSKNRSRRLPGTFVNKSFATDPANAEIMKQFYLKRQYPLLASNPITGNSNNASSPCVNLMFGTGMSIDEWAARTVNNGEAHARRWTAKYWVPSDFKCPETFIARECVGLAEVVSGGRFKK